MGPSTVSIRHTTRVHGPEVMAHSRQGHGGLSKRGHVVSASEALWSRPARPCGLGNGGLGNGGLGNGGLGNGGLDYGGLGNGGLGNGGLGNGGLGQQDVGKTPLLIGTMLGITRFLNGSPSFNEAVGMSGTDPI